MTSTVELARGVERMLTQAGIQPGVRVSYAPEAEKGNRGQPMAYILPDGILSQRRQRAGTNTKQRTIGVVLIRDAEPNADPPSTVEGMLGFVDQIMDLLATNPPIDEEDNPLAKAGDIDADPIYSADQLAQGVFVATIRVEYLFA